MTGRIGARGRVRGPALTLPGQPESVRQFRELARQAATTPYQGEAAALCVSELVTNAIVHTWSGRPGGVVTVHFDRGPQPGELSVSVVDDGPLSDWHGQPDMAWRPAAPEGPDVPERGYGLGIVDAVAVAWWIADSVAWCVIPEAAL
jgi:anti-sigma regulatory factor (Ser/Thr protein kinase)